MRPTCVAAALAAAACLLPETVSAVDGTFGFVDPKIQIRSQALANISGSAFQIDGLVTQQNASINPNQIIQICSTASGTADKSDADTTKGSFSSAVLTLTILNVITGGTTVDFPPTTVTLPCKYKAVVKKGGALISTRLACDVGENMNQFPGLTADQLDSITTAFKSRKTTRLNPKSGKLRFTLNGVPTPQGETPMEPCPTGAPPPPPP